MSVEVTRLPSGLTVVTDAMPHLETASLGVWVGAGSRDELGDKHGISHLLEHMAFKGTKRRTARQIAEEIEAVGGDLNAATSVETTAYYARVLRADVPLALDVLSDILAEPAFDPEELPREQNVICRRSVPPKIPPTTWCSTICRRLLSQSRRSGARSRQPRERALVQCAAAAISVAQLSRPQHGGGGDWLGRPRDDRGKVENRFASFSGPRRRRSKPAQFVGGTYIERRDLEQAHLGARLRRPAAARSRPVQPADVFQHHGWRDVIAAVPGSA